MSSRRPARNNESNDHVSSDGLYIREKDTIQVISGDQTQQVINVLDLVNGKFRYARFFLALPNVKKPMML